LEFRDVGFCGWRKTGEHGEKPSERGVNKQQTQPTYDTGPESNPGHIAGRRALSILPHPCSLITTLLHSCNLKNCLKRQTVAVQWLAVQWLEFHANALYQTEVLFQAYFFPRKFVRWDRE